MASTECVINCGPCEYSQVFIPANIWCPVCEEGLCNDCTKHHKAAKITRTHEPIPISSYADIPNEVFELNMECQLHKEKFELYCPNHEMHCCVQCASIQHPQCKGITLLDKFIENIKSSESLSPLEQICEDRKKCLDMLKDNRLSNIKRIEEQALRLMDDFDRLRTQIVDNLNRYHTELKLRLDDVKTTQKGTIMKTVEIAESQNTVYDRMMSSVTKVKTNGTNLQVYLMMKQLEEKLKKEDDITKSLEKQDGTQEIDVSFSPNPVVASVISTEFDFGTIEIEKSSQTIDMKKTENALTPVKCRVDKLSMKMLIDTNTATEDYYFGEKPNLSSIVSLPNGDIIAADFGEKGGILVFDQKGNFQSKITKFGRAHSVCLISDSLLAVSFPLNQNIKLISGGMSLSKTIRINNYCFGMSMSEGKIVLCVRPTGIYVIDLDGTVLKQVNINNSDITYVHGYNKQIIATDLLAREISWYDIDGVELWKFHCESGTDTRNCCVDKFGNIFMLEMKLGNILHISPENKCSQILVRRLDLPKAIAYDRDSNSLVIAGANGEFSAMYDISYC